MKFRIIDLCAGIGGIRRGFELAGGFTNVLSAEIDPYACKSYEHIFGENPYGDITSNELKKKVEATDYDTLLAGFPCQSFSRAGKERGFMDATRGTLFFDIADIIRRSRPKTFLLENVDSLLSHNKGNTMNVILNVLNVELNYKIIGVTQDSQGNLVYERSSFLRNSRDFGMPHNRPRVYIIGFDSAHYGSSVESLLKVHLPVKRESHPVYKDLNQLLEFNAPIEFYISQGYLDSLKRHKARHANKGNGFGYIIVNEPGKENPYANAILATGGSGKERNLVYDPQDGIAGLIVKNKESPINDEGIRYMTPREWGKLQGFINYAYINDDGTDSFTMPSNISNTQLYKQFGNSVTIPVIEQIAMFMKMYMQMLQKATSTTSSIPKHAFTKVGNRKIFIDYASAQSYQHYCYLLYYTIKTA